MDHIISTKLLVTGIRSDDQVVRALQSLYDVFTEQQLGQATFEIEGEDAPAALWIKHRESVEVDRAAIGAALARAGDFHLINGEPPLNI